MADGAGLGLDEVMPPSADAGIAAASTSEQWLGFLEELVADPGDFNDVLEGKMCGLPALHSL